MSKRIGAICVFLGICCLITALSLVVYNRFEEKNAEKVSRSILADVQCMIEEPFIELSPQYEFGSVHNDAENIPLEMATVEVDGYDCIGILSVPVLNLELPVLTDWSYSKLKKAPCHYYGTYYEKNFVISAHNYKSHFGRLSELQSGDMVSFTDVNGNAFYYNVVLLETLPKEATKEMITSDFDLSLYTCTPGGSGRVTVRCNLADHSYK